MNEYPLPVAFVEQMRLLLNDDADAFLSSYAETPLRGLRFRDARRPLSSDDLCGSIPYARNAYYLKEDSLAGALPLHEAGAYYIQEPSAMTAAAVLAPEDGDRVLDLCAAPGGKSTQLAASAKLSLLIANEPISSRAQILSRNIERMGIPNAVVTSAYPQSLAEKWPQFFDKILVDAPCSGEGMFRRHPETRSEWSSDSPTKCASRQRDILDQAAKMLRSGGRMVYSTCTFNKQENEDTIAYFLQTHPNFELIPFNLAGMPAAPSGMLHVWPHQVKGEGHFVALMQKNDALKDEEPPIAPVFLPQPALSTVAAFTQFSKDIALSASITANSEFANRLIHISMPLPPLDKLRVLRVGLHLGEVRSKMFFPDHALALAIPVSKTIALDAAQTIAYIHGEALPCADDLRGFYIVSTEGYQLGFVKASNGFLKNHYPKGLRK